MVPGQRRVKVKEEGSTTIHDVHKLERVRCLIALGEGMSGVVVGASTIKGRNPLRVSPSEKRSQLPKKEKTISFAVVVLIKDGKSLTHGEIDAYTIAAAENKGSKSGGDADGGTSEEGDDEPTTFTLEVGKANANYGGDGWD
ncbi:hypothetical protein VNO77_26922 [Canavalia gladiata]|uniref:Uncharacterized protein n=1 Tax=Canavalia gladiata TaxID=3824 RepID=A0AAN9Q6P8_CANGL